ncbi:MAG TPA: hypothetical protein VMV73_05410, partial [Candidatus Dormibacteraeota bacterium]|nr:hypothetical protein [Candidatus Dormibacteraeota bacterium]
ITDPMSQQKYMWNDNNPIAYSDPSGYDPTTTWEAVGGGIGEGVCLVLEPCGIGQLVVVGIGAAAIGLGINSAIRHSHWTQNGSKARGPASWPAQLTEKNLPSSYKPPKRKGPKNRPVWGMNRQGKEGWIDRNGDIWQEPKAGGRHGAPHWDVQLQDGSHINIDAKIPVIR